MRIICAAKLESLIRSPPLLLPRSPPIEAAESNGRARRVNPIKRKQMQDRLVFVEAEIPRVETAIAETEQAMGNFVSAEETQRNSSALEVYAPSMPASPKSGKV